MLPIGIGSLHALGGDCSVFELENRLFSGVFLRQLLGLVSGQRKSSAFSWTVVVSRQLPAFFQKLFWHCFKNFTLSTKFVFLMIITVSMVLKFLLQRKHLARLVSGFVAVLNSVHNGQRKRKNPLLNLDGTIRIFSIRISMGI